MEFAYDRYLDDSRSLHLTVSLRSRTTEMHSALSALTPEERAEVGRVLTAAIDEAAAIVRRRAAGK